MALNKKWAENEVQAASSGSSFWPHRCILWRFVTDGASKPLTKLLMHVQESVSAILTASTTDVLSHVAIRARSQRVLLATCFEEAQLSALKQLEGGTVSLVVDASGAVTTAAAGASQVHLLCFSW